MYRKQRFTKKVESKNVWQASPWRICRGVLVPRGRNTPPESLVKALGEKLPYECLDEIEDDVKTQHPELERRGVYIAHDSMGTPRYVGLGKVFTRLRARRRAHPLELKYFSFFLIGNRDHSREIETLLIRAGGPILEFNEQKKRATVDPGSVRDFEPGTVFYQRRKSRKK